MSLAGKTAIVTGGAQGIGLEICSKLLENDVKVALCDINVEKGLSAVEQLKCKHSKHDCCFFSVDISDKVQFKECFRKIINHYGSIDILINNAGVADDSLENWEKQVDINCKGTVWGCIFGIQSLYRGGVIINISSTLSVKPYALMPIYGMTKAAITNLTLCLGSKEYFDKYGIKVIAVLPGITDTPILQNNRHQYIFPEIACYREELRKNLGVLQSPGFVAECTIQALKFGKNGSLWIAQDGKPPHVALFNYTLQETTNDASD